MGRFNANDADNYGGNGGSTFFSLKNDKDIARVRFAYNGMEDVEGYAVHEVNISGKRRYVNCLREYNEPKSACPFCNANYMQIAKVYVPVYDETDKTVKVWERGKTFLQKLSGICSRYTGNGKPLVSHQFEIERNGKAGDTSTTYEIYPVGDSDNVTMNDIPELPQVLGTIILDKSAAEMEAYLRDGFFPNMDGAPSRNNSSEPVGRRTPGREVF